MITTIIFDLGGVYLHGSIHTFMQRAYRVLGREDTHTPGEEIVFDERLNMGQDTPQECFARIFDISPTDPKMPKLLRLWERNWQPDPAMKSLMERLKPNYTLAALSNWDAGTYSYGREHGWFDIFDELFLSHQLGMLKPDERIFQKAIEILDVEPNECIYVDDQQPVVDKAHGLGFHSFLYESTEKLEHQLNNIL